jgi:hypothetical protein
VTYEHGFNHLSTPRKQGYLIYDATSGPLFLY